MLNEIEKHLTKLAIETIITDQQKLIKVFLPPQSSEYLSYEKVTDKENRIAINGMKFGLLFKKIECAKIQSWHRMYAEYLFAKEVLDVYQILLNV